MSNPIGIVGRHTSFDLTAEHKAAITANDPLTVVIGIPGSGKSGVLCGHIRFLTTASDARPPWASHQQIVALAFTARSATEIIIRLHTNDPDGRWNQSGEHPEAPFVGTHHKFLLWLINQYKELLGYPEHIKKLRFITDQHRHNLMIDIGNDLRRRQNQTRVFVDETGIEAKTQARIQSLITEKGWIDYQRLVNGCKQLLDNPQVREELRQRRFRLLIDEAQDLGEEESAIYDKLPTETRFIVGDRAQAIFFQKETSLLQHYANQPGARIIELRHNFRSFPNICLAAYQLIQNHRPELVETPPQAVRTPSRPDAPTVIFWECDDDDDQTKMAIKLIKHYSEVAPKRYQLNEVALLYQDTYQANLLQKACANEGIPVFDPSSLEREPENHNPYTAPSPLVHPNAVNLVKVTQCKGLEFPTVIIPFCTQKNWPGKTDYNLSRRQLYTAMTRAQNTVHFLYHSDTEASLAEKTGRPVSNYPTRVVTAASPFLKEMNQPQRVAVTYLSRETNPA